MKGNRKSKRKRVMATMKNPGIIQGVFGIIGILCFLPCYVLNIEKAFQWPAMVILFAGLISTVFAFAKRFWGWFLPLVLSLLVCVHFFFHCQWVEFSPFISHGEFSVLLIFSVAIPVMMLFLQFFILRCVDSGRLFFAHPEVYFLHIRKFIFFRSGTSKFAVVDLTP